MGCCCARGDKEKSTTRRARKGDKERGVNMKELKKPARLAASERESDHEAIGDGSSDGEEEDGSSSVSDGGAGIGDEVSDEESEDETERAKRELADVPFGVLQVIARLAIAARRFCFSPDGRAAPDGNPSTRAVALPRARSARLSPVAVQRGR
jgi:hypothetical protein